MISRYSRKELTDIWSEKNKYKIWLEVEIAAAQAMEKYKIIPKGVSAIVKKKGKIKVERIHKIEAKVKHDVIAFLTSILLTELVVLTEYTDSLSDSFSCSYFSCVSKNLTFSETSKSIFGVVFTLADLSSFWVFINSVYVYPVIIYYNQYCLSFIYKYLYQFYTVRNVIIISI